MTLNLGRVAFYLGRTPMGLGILVLAYKNAQGWNSKTLRLW